MATTTETCPVCGHSLAWGQHWAHDNGNLFGQVVMCKDCNKDCSVEYQAVKDYQAVAQAERLLDRLDTEDDDYERAILIDDMIELADLYPQVAEMWRQYR
jgi:hypothetical protein